MDKLWQAENLYLHMLPYHCLATGNGVGLIEVILNAETVSSIQLSYGGSRAAFRDQPLDEWLRKHNPDDKDYEKAVQVFTRSCAGYCVATYILGIGDRHNDNIMLSKAGNLFHIDFGHFLGNIKRKFGFKRERAPFVLTPDFVYVMGKRESENFKEFVELCVQAYLVIRRHAKMFINLFAMVCVSLCFSR
jgi:phosphatidylinositol-4,5-bisphosphate 3-kinase